MPMRNPHKTRRPAPHNRSPSPNSLVDATSDSLLPSAMGPGTPRDKPLGGMPENSNVSPSHHTSCHSRPRASRERSIRTLERRQQDAARYKSASSANRAPGARGASLVGGPIGGA